MAGLRTPISGLTSWASVTALLRSWARRWYCLASEECAGSRRPRMGQPSRAIYVMCPTSAQSALRVGCPDRTGTLGGNDPDPRFVVDDHTVVRLGIRTFFEMLDDIRGRRRGVGRPPRARRTGGTGGAAGGSWPVVVGGPDDSDCRRAIRAGRATLVAERPQTTHGSGPEAQGTCRVIAQHIRRESR